jgi:hypothetical protein
VSREEGKNILQSCHVAFLPSIRIYSLKTYAIDRSEKQLNERRSKERVKMQAGN